MSKNAAFYFFCYLFKSQNEQHGEDVFTAEGFRNCKHASTKLTAYVGRSNSSRNVSAEKRENLLRQKQHIDNDISKFFDRARDQYRTRLNAYVDSIWYILR